MLINFRTLIKKVRKFFYTFLAIQRIGNYEEKPNVNRRTYFTKNTFLGKNCHFNGMSIEGGGKITIGNNFHSGKDILIITQNHDYDHGSALPYSKEYMFEPVIIEDNVWIGSRVIILPGSIIGEGAIIQAGSVVASKIPPLAIAGGHPAQPFKYRDKNHYIKLKKLKQFI